MQTDAPEAQNAEEESREEAVNPTTSNQPSDRTNEQEAETKTYPGLVLWIGAEGLDFQVSDMVQKYQEIITMTGIQLLECRVSRFS